MIRQSDTDRQPFAEGSTSAKSADSELSLSV